MFGMLLMLLVLVTGRGWAADEGEIPLLQTPDNSGDQLIFYYDARADFTTFLTIQNAGSDVLTVNLQFYGPTFDTPFSKTIPIASGAMTIVDVGAFRGVGGLPQQASVALATPVDLARHQPITTSAMIGSFTVANLLTGSAFGSPAAARSASRRDGSTQNGEVIDGATYILQQIRPDSARLVGYYDPASLAPVANGGNQLIFVNFEDSYGPAFGATIGGTTWTAFATRSDGVALPPATFISNGVTVSDLASVAGPGVNGSAGSLTAGVLRRIARDVRHRLSLAASNPTVTRTRTRI